MAYGWSANSISQRYTYVDCATLSQFCVHYRDCRDGAIFKLLLYYIAVLCSYFLYEQIATDNCVVEEIKVLIVLL